MGSQVVLLSGPPGCGKTSWALKSLQEHQGTRAYIRLEGESSPTLEQGIDSGIDQAWLEDQVPNLQSALPACKEEDNQLLIIELQEFNSPEKNGIDAFGVIVSDQLNKLCLKPTTFLHFGRDAELPTNDTLDFSALNSFHHGLGGAVWDPESLNAFWFELVNGAYGDVYRAKALMNLPDGRSFFFNWMVSQQGSQFLPLNEISPPNGRPKRVSELVVQGRDLDHTGIRSTIDDCLVSDDVLEVQQQQLRTQQKSHS